MEKRKKKKKKGEDGGDSLFCDSVFLLAEVGNKKGKKKKKEAKGKALDGTLVRLLLLALFH